MICAHAGGDVEVSLIAEGFCPVCRVQLERRLMCGICSCCGNGWWCESRGDVVNVGVVRPIPALATYDFFGVGKVTER